MIHVLRSGLDRWTVSTSRGQLSREDLSLSNGNTLPRVTIVRGEELDVETSSVVLLQISTDGSLGSGEKI
jgi:hypothetical protein